MLYFRFRFIFQLFQFIEVSSQKCDVDNFDNEVLRLDIAWNPIKITANTCKDFRQNLWRRWAVRKETSQVPIRWISFLIKCHQWTSNYKTFQKIINTYITLKFVLLHKYKLTTNYCQWHQCRFVSHSVERKLAHISYLKFHRPYPSTFEMI